MERIIRIICLLLVVSNLATAQTIVKDYFGKEGFTRDPAKSTYYRVATKIAVGRKGKRDSVFIDSVRTFYTKTNRIHSRAFYKDGDLTGPYIMYHENGVIKEKGTYKEDYKTGNTSFWNDKGILRQVLEYFSHSGSFMGELDSFKIINYWDDANNQLVKEGNGECRCSFYETWPQEEGQVVGGYRDEAWSITSGDTIISVEEYKKGKLLKGESTYKGGKFEYAEKFRSAEFRDGIPGMARFLRQTIKYPSEARRNGIQGRVFVRFIIDANGNVSDLEVVKGVSDALDRESIRVVKASNKKWIPAKSRGVPIKSTYVLPVYFKLES